MTSWRQGLAAVLASVAVVSSCGTDDPGNQNSEEEVEVEPPLPAFAAGVFVDRVLLAQSTGVVLADDGVTRLDRDAPVVADREGTLRVVLDDANAEAREVRVVVEMLDAEDTVTQVVEEVIGIGNGEGQAEATLTVPADAIRPESALAVLVLELDEQLRRGDSSGARWPAGGAFVQLDARMVPPLRVVLIALQVAGEGPRLDEDRVRFYRDALFGWFPTSTVEVSVHPEPLERDPQIQIVDDVANEVFVLGQRRLDDGVDDDVIYFGVYDNAIGLGLAGATDFSEELRAAVGPGDGSATSAKIMAHEIGHLLGARHAPSCGAGFADPNFPDENGGVGVETIDPLTGAWLQPTVPDMMGFCLDVAVSPYTAARFYRGLTWWEQP